MATTVRNYSNPTTRTLGAAPHFSRQWRSYPAAKAEIAQLAHVRHVFVKASARVNNRAENSHQPTRERERRMRGFRRPERTQAFLSSFGPIRQHFALKRHLLRASWLQVVSREGDVKGLATLDDDEPAQLPGP